MSGKCHYKHQIICLSICNCYQNKLSFSKYCYIWQMNQEAIVVTTVLVRKLNNSLPLAIQHFYRLLPRSSEVYSMQNKYIKATFTHKTLLPTKLFHVYTVTFWLTSILLKYSMGFSSSSMSILQPSLHFWNANPSVTAMFLPRHSFHFTTLVTTS